MPLCWTRRAAAIYARWGYVESLAQKTRARGRRHVRLEAEYEILRGLMLGVAVSVVRNGKRGNLLPDALEEAEERCVARALRWYETVWLKRLYRVRSRTLRIRSSEP